MPTESGAPRTGRMAKRRAKAMTLAGQYYLNGDRETGDYYASIADRLEKKLIGLSSCLKCGRRIKDGGVDGTNLGPECHASSLCGQGAT